MIRTKSTLENRLNNEISLFLSKSKNVEYQMDVKQSITYDDFLADKMLIILAIRSGIPYSLFDLIQFQAPFTESDWANFLDISTKSLQRYKSSPDHHFKPIHSEKIIEVAEVTKIGMDVFGGMDKFKLWLQTPNFALGKIKPIELLKDSYGKDLVVTELIHINHGILV